MDQPGEGYELAHVDDREREGFLAGDLDDASPAEYDFFRLIPNPQGADIYVEAGDDIDGLNAGKELFRITTGSVSERERDDRLGTLEDYLDGALDEFGLSEALGFENVGLSEGENNDYGDVRVEFSEDTDYDHVRQALEESGERTSTKFWRPEEQSDSELGLDAVMSILEHSYEGGDDQYEQFKDDALSVATEALVLDMDSHFHLWIGDRPFYKSAGDEMFGGMRIGDVGKNKVFKRDGGIPKYIDSLEFVDNEGRDEIDWRVGVVESGFFPTVAVPKDIDEQIAVREGQFDRLQPDRDNLTVTLLENGRINDDLDKGVNNKERAVK